MFKLHFTLQGAVFQWRGPAPYYYIALPETACEQIRGLANEVSYGWGVIPVEARIGGTAFTTSLFPKDGRYLLPLKYAVRKAEGIGDGQTIDYALSLTLTPRERPQRPSKARSSG